MSAAKTSCIKRQLNHLQYLIINNLSAIDDEMILFCKYFNLTEPYNNKRIITPSLFRGYFTNDNGKWQYDQVYFINSTPLLSE